MLMVRVWNRKNMCNVKARKIIMGLVTEQTREDTGYMLGNRDRELRPDFGKLAWNIE